MADTRARSALTLESSCALSAVAFSERRRQGVRLISGARRGFALDKTRTFVHVPYPPTDPSWTRRTLTCGVALQCSPSKDRLAAAYPLHELSPRTLGALTIVEGGVALGWIATRWPGLLPEARRALPGLEFADGELDAAEMLDLARALAESREQLPTHPLLGQLPLTMPARNPLSAAVRRAYGRVPWTTQRKMPERLWSVPVGGEGGVRNPNLPPPSRPEDDDIAIRSDSRAGIPYPEWNAWTQRFLKDHVAILERTFPAQRRPPASARADVRRWFEEHTHRAMCNGLEDGSDLDIDRYVSHYVDTISGEAAEARVFRDLSPSFRDVNTALLLDGSSSLGIHHGRFFQLELACADALSRAMTAVRERHGIFVFSGNTRHRVEVRCLKDFHDSHFVDPSGLGLKTGGYTRLGAPVRHLTSRLLAQPSERRLLIVIGDGLMSDEGYEGRYAWADVAHAVEEANDAGVTVYYLGVGPTRVDPLPEVFGPRRSTRIRRIEDLPRVLAHVHRELVAA
jgi:nitric oxide reductase NorD protein